METFCKLLAIYFVVLIKRWYHKVCNGMELKDWLKVVANRELVSEDGFIGFCKKVPDESSQGFHLWKQSYVTLEQKNVSTYGTGEYMLEIRTWKA